MKIGEIIKLHVGPRDSEAVSNVVNVKKKQKKWIPPLQQMLDIMKQSHASKLTTPVADPTLSLVESINTSIDSFHICEECGKLNLPENLSESTANRLTKKWDKLREGVIGTIPPCSKH